MGSTSDRINSPKSSRGPSARHPATAQITFLWIIATIGRKQNSRLQIAFESLSPFTPAQHRERSEIGPADLDIILFVDRDNAPIICQVMERAERYSICSFIGAPRGGDGVDVCRFDEV